MSMLKRNFIIIFIYSCAFGITRDWGSAPGIMMWDKINVAEASLGKNGEFLISSSDFTEY